MDKVLRDEQDLIEVILTKFNLLEYLHRQSSLYMNIIDTIDYEIPSKIVNIIKTLYEKFSVQVIHETSLTDPFQVKTGVKQDCSRSLTLFLIVMD